MAKITIENVVASTTLGTELDLLSLSQIFENAEYNPKRFPGLVFKTREPKAAALIFRSGKVVCTGAKSIEDVKKTMKRVVEMLKEKGIKVTEKSDITIQNIVACADLNTELNLNGIAMSIGLENIEYEPEQFPGLVYRMDDPKVVLLLFGSGKLVITGCKDAKDAERAVDKIVDELKSLNLL
ncbi:MAG: TATA-box-binding protein [Candidatus Syntropharchaeia archaeon]